MTNVSEESFLLRLYDVASKLSRIAKIVWPNFKKEWDENFAFLNQTPNVIRQISVGKEKFLNEIDYRIEILDNIRLSFEEGFNLIKFLLNVLYNHYFKNLREFKQKYSERDQLILKYVVAKEILGNLIEYNKLDHKIIPLKYNILASNYTMIKLKGLKDVEILEKMKKIKIELDLNNLDKLMDEIVEDGFLNKTRYESYSYYTLKSELILSEEGGEVYNHSIEPLVKWPISFWEYYYNIRELNVIVGNEIEHGEILNNILVRAAIQGYVACHYVFENLVKYYQDIKKNR